MELIKALISLAFLLICSRAAPDGTICVNSELVTMFDLINDLRSKGKESKIYKVLVDADSSYTT